MSAQPMRWVKVDLAAAGARHVAKLMTMRLPIISFAGTVRTGGGRDGERLVHVRREYLVDREGA